MYGDDWTFPPWTRQESDTRKNQTVSGIYYGRSWATRVASAGRAADVQKGTMVDAAELTAKLKGEAHRLGFDLAGACPAQSPPGLVHFRRWLAAGHAGEMAYFARRSRAYEHPRHVLPQAQSLLVLGMNYRTSEPAAVCSGQGRVSRYAWGSADYHDLVRQRLRRLAAFHRRLTPEASVRGVVDTAPLLERDFARLAGLGWIGKNTLLLNRHLGSWFFLAVLLTSETLDYDEPTSVGSCGSCQACLDACPTGALVGPYQLDARRCVSYLTIELRGWPLDGDPRRIGKWVFGCDACQEVCPWNRRTRASGEPAFQPRPDLNPVRLAKMLCLDEASYKARFRRTPLIRPKRSGLLRNAAVVTANNPSPASLQALSRGLNDPDAVIRCACAWAIGRTGARHAHTALRDRMEREDDPAARREIRESLDALAKAGAS